jgi:hypothetical protein
MLRQRQHKNMGAFKCFPIKKMFPTSVTARYDKADRLCGKLCYDSSYEAPLSPVPADSRVAPTYNEAREESGCDTDTTSTSSIVVRAPVSCCVPRDLCAVRWDL